MEDKTVYWYFEKPVRAPVYDLDGHRLPSDEYMRLRRLIDAYQGDMSKLSSIVQYELELLREKKKLQPETNEVPTKDR